MKVSKYNKLIKMGSTSLMFNSMSCALAEVDSDFFNILENIENIEYDELDEKNKTLVDGMIEGNYIVNNEVNEFNMIKYRNLVAKFNNSIGSITIAPTLQCNFACPYCYESPKDGIMTIEVQDNILKMIKDNICNIKTLDVIWYGGEPLIAKDVIVNMSNQIIELCKDNNIEYKSSMITNGYLLNENLIDELMNLKVDMYQITIDGPPEIHNIRRRFKGMLGDTFTKILENLKLLKSKGARPNIRVNVDNTNIEYINELLDILESNDLKDININFGHVKTYSKVCNSAISCMCNEEFAKFDIKYNKILNNRGFNVNKMYYPSLKSNYCCADSLNAFVIDPEGYIYNCWNDVGNHSKARANISNLNDTNEKMYNNNMEYLLWSPFDNNECKDCMLLPICMGGCPYNAINNNLKGECEKWKYVIDEVLIETYESNKE